MHPHLYKRPCPSVGRLVVRFVRNAFVKIDEKRTITDDGRGKKREEEEGGTGRKREGEEGVTGRKEGREEQINEKVVKKNEK